MAIPTLTPTSSISAVRLPATGTHTDVTLANLPFGVYAIDGALFDANFVSGAVDQVAHTYRKLGGDVLDIEIKEQNVYAAYEESVLEYSYIINTHQAKNILSNVLGGSTGSLLLNIQNLNLVMLKESVKELQPQLVLEEAQPFILLRLIQRQAGKIMTCKKLFPLQPILIPI